MWCRSEGGERVVGAGWLRSEGLRYLKSLLLQL